jgi:penicillin V acylase-like amidase (Ntn superfamily)
MKITKPMLAFGLLTVGSLFAVDVMAYTRVVYKGPSQTVLTGRTMDFSIDIPANDDKDAENPSGQKSQQLTINQDEAAPYQYSRRQ